MDMDLLSGQWTELNGSAKTKWAKLTDDDLIRADGEYDKLAASIQKRYGYTLEQAEDEVNAWTRRFHETRDGQCIADVLAG